MSVLREVKYLDLGDSGEIPIAASKIFEQKELYRQYVANLDLTEQWYNKVYIVHMIETFKTLLNVYIRFERQFWMWNCL